MPLETKSAGFNWVGTYDQARGSVIALICAAILAMKGSTSRPGARIHVSTLMESTKKKTRASETGKDLWILFFKWAPSLAPMSSSLGMVLALLELTLPRAATKAHFPVSWLKR